MKSSFLKRLSKRKIGLQCQVHRFCFGKELFIHAYICAYLRNTLFQKILSELGIFVISNWIFGLALIAFWKRALHGEVAMYIY